MDNKITSPAKNDLLRFVILRPAAYTVTLPDPDNPITQQYKYSEDTPDVIFMHETDSLGFDCHYVFRLEERELIIESCTETTESGERVERPAGYVYLRQPLSKKKPEEWEYRLSDNLRVVCIARLREQEINETVHEIIHLSRLFYYADKPKSEPDMIIEQYADGFGIIQKLVLFDKI